MADTAYRVWDDDSNTEYDGHTEAEGEDIELLNDGPRDVAIVYVKGFMDVDNPAPSCSVTVSVRNKSTNELTRWVVTVDYEPTFTARLRTGEVSP